MATDKITKALNYTAEQESALSTAYNASDSAEAREAVIEQFAEIMGKNTRSILAKLVSLGIYQKAPNLRKDGTTVEKKNETADAIGAVLKLSEADTSSLTNCNRKALQAIWQALATSKPISD